jgi:hypothetical protein
VRGAGRLVIGLRGGDIVPDYNSLILYEKRYLILTSRLTALISPTASASQTLSLFWGSSAPPRILDLRLMGLPSLLVDFLDRAAEEAREVLFVLGSGLVGMGMTYSVWK